MRFSTVLKTYLSVAIIAIEPSNMDSSAASRFVVNKPLSVLEQKRRSADQVDDKLSSFIRRPHEAKENNMFKVRQVKID